MKKTLFFACIVLAIWGCGGDMDELPSCLTCDDFCGSQRYDSSTQSCCGNEIYSIETQFCSEGSVFLRCGSGSYGTYNPSTQGCCDNNRIYAMDTSFCSGSLVYTKCSGNSYTPSTQYCSNGTIKAYSGTIGYAGQTYKTQIIGTQTWMAENLNYNAPGSECNDKDKSDNCTGYGRFYDWSTAMDLPSNCNSNSCSNQIQSQHRGICPSGWHIPSNDDWNILEDYAGGSSVAGKHLKAVSGWNPSSGIENLDTHGFSALPGDRGNSDGKFGDVGSHGAWWSASEVYSGSADGRHMYHRSDGGADYNSSSKSDLFSVRCVQDAVSNGRGNNISNYKTVKINDQTWMAENLDYAIEGSRCYNNNPANCLIYGRLYDWATAMGLSSNCNSNSCSSQIQAKHRGICPSGWHIPSGDDWYVLIDNVGGYETAGTKLKATSGWYSKRSSDRDKNGNGTDEYGFSALPGGSCFSGNNYGNVGYCDNWWSASEYTSDRAYGRDMGYDYEYAGWYGSTKTYLFSVRCLHDSSSSFISGGKGNNISNYKTIKIGDQTWMAENLDYAVEGGKCYNNSKSYCDIYGRLYDWATAMALPSSCNSTDCSSQIQAKHRGICPSGWHIPNAGEWAFLEEYVGGNETAETKLKAASGWNDGNGTDEFGFSALPGGYGGSNVGNGGYWWSASEYDSDDAYFRDMGYNIGGANWGYYYKTSLFSVRCLHDSSISFVSSGKGNDISNYKTVKIGDQTWMAENLDYAIEGSKCNYDSEYYCNKYGRLYDWSTAMDLPSSCNSTYCSNQQSPNRGICPSGWHLPTRAEWNTLSSYVQSTSGCSSCDARLLKATSGWNGSNGNGTDDYGFSALPGISYSVGSFYRVGQLGRWWSASESRSYDAYYRSMSYYDEFAHWYDYDKTSLFSVRCLQD